METLEMTVAERAQDLLAQMDAHEATKVAMIAELRMQRDAIDKALTSLGADRKPRARKLGRPRGAKNKPKEDAGAVQSVSAS